MTSVSDDIALLRRLSETPGELLVASEAAARFWRQRLYGSLAEGEARYEHCRILTVDAWLSGLWDGLFESRYVMRPMQALALATDVVSRGGWLDDTVLDTRSVARQLLNAFELSARYRLSPVSGGISDSRELRCYTEFAAVFEAALNERGALISAQIPAALLAANIRPRGALTQTEGVILAPAILHWLSEIGVDIASVPTPAATAEQPCALRFATVNEEWTGLATWIAEHLQRKPDCRLAVVLPDAGIDTAPLAQTLYRAVYPQLLVPEQAAGEQLLEPWQFVGKGRLSDYPIIRAAADICGLAQGTLTHADFARLLKSPFIAGSSDASRGVWEWRLREELGGEFHLAGALRSARRGAEDDAITDDAIAVFEALEKQLARWRSGGRSVKTSAATWAARFRELLALAQWPNRPIGDTVVEQCVAGLSDTLDVLGSLATVLPSIDGASASQWLQLLLDNRRFDLRRSEPAPVQILSPEHAAGGRFDAIWIAGCAETALPAPVRRNPFLAPESLRAAGVPGTDPELCLRDSETLLQWLFNAAPEVVLSVAEQSVDGVALTPTGLWAWPDAHDVPPAPSTLRFEATLLPGETETVSPVDDAERDSLRGGSALIGAMARSPFVAFCQYRLQLREFPPLSEGLDARDQGECLHRALELFWRHLRDSEKLSALNVEQLRHRLHELLPEVYYAPRYARYGRELLTLEMRRAETVLLNWLAWEQARTEPFEVVAMEQRFDTALCGIPLSLRIDRMDTVAPGKLLVMDYKSGKARHQGLDPDLLLEPQLPLYAVLGEGPNGEAVDGLALAGLNHGDKPDVAVRSAWTASLDGSKPRHGVSNPERWEDSKTRWRERLELTAQEFLAGDFRHSDDDELSFQQWLQGLWS